MDTITICLLISLIILLNFSIITSPFVFMEEINVEDGIAKLCFNGMNELNQRKIFLPNMIYAFYFKNIRYGRYEPQIYKYVRYNPNTNRHFFKAMITNINHKYSECVFITVDGTKNDMMYTTEDDDEILKIILAPEYGL